ncbi:MAG: hypothetical protein A2Z17_04605 [Gammaproteobacteria bacterium RBG_16_66_13]|nr:MAG: hypothetical protein A2Z17_04605 [Gammaproteobacteria bacterium RBG_16_66_13]
MPHLRLSEAAALQQLAREELEDEDRKIEQRAKKTAEERTRRLKRALREARGQGTGKAFERAARLIRRPPKPRPTRQEKRLDELARRIPADRLSLTFALLCGTPVLPPGFVPWGVDDDALPFALVRPPSLPAGMAWELTEDAGLVFTIYSSKIRQLKAAYRDVVEHHQRIVSLNADSPAYSSGGSLTAAYAAGPGLPRITIDTRRAADFSWPPSDLVDGVFRAARRTYAKLLYDGGRKGRDARFAVRAWTVAFLSDQAKISRRAAISSWNRFAPGDLSYRHTPRGVTSSGEVQLQKDYRRLRERIERFASAVSTPPRKAS